ncbi:MAG: ATP-dependent DNA ligase, partial [uncultured Thermoleophilia bacterium]
GGVRRRGGRGGRTVARRLPPGARVLRRAGRDEARPRPVLHRARGARPAGHRPAPDHDGALPGRSRRQVLVPEARPEDRPRVADDRPGRDAERHHLRRARGHGSGARRLGRQQRLPRVPRLADALRRPGRGRRAPDRPRSHGGRHARDGARGGARGADAARRARPPGLPEDDGPPGHPRLRAGRREPRLLRRAGGRRGVRARARTPSPRPPDGRLVEGGARAPRVRRLQPERAAQDRVLGLGRPAAPRWAGLDAVRLGRARVDRSRDPHDRLRARARGGGRRSVGRDRRPPVLARAPARAVRARPRRRADGRSLAARLPEDAERAAARRAEPRPQAGRSL